MKISRLEIKDYHQFRNLDLDLTYPKGHAKEGKPLDKVCFIGQSGTGKTTLLKFLFDNTMSKTGQYAPDPQKLENNLFIHYVFKNYETRVTSMGEVWKKLNGELVSHTSSGNHHYDMLISQFISLSQVFLIYFPAEFKSESPNSIKGDSIGTKKIYDFSDSDMNLIWSNLLDEIQLFQEKALIMTQGIAKAATRGNYGKDDLTILLDGLKELGSIKHNPLLQLAEKCLDPVLRNFGLKVNTEFDIKAKADIGNITIADMHGNKISFDDLSTGTKQIIFSALPLYTLKPTQSILFYDEPERSLYPDMQKIIVDYYMSFTKDSQFFFATHSPIIASCFEPWEIVELKFDDNGYVQQELYYDKDKERHVDNYTIIPSYLTYDLMLSKVFDVKEPNNEERNLKITDLLTMKAQLERMKGKQENNTDAFKKTYAQYEDLASKLSWNFKS